MTQQQIRFKTEILPPHWQEYLACLLLHMLLPLLPIVLELCSKGNISDNTITLSTAMYAITIGVSSVDLSLLSLTIFISILYSAAFGMVVSKSSSLYGVSSASFVTIILIFVVH